MPILHHPLCPSPRKSTRPSSNGHRDVAAGIEVAAFDGDPGAARERTPGWDHAGESGSLPKEKSIPGVRQAGDRNPCPQVALSR